MGADGGHPAAGPRDEDGDPGQKGRGRGRKAAGRCPDVHGVEDEVERPGAGGRAGEADRVLVADGDADSLPDGAAGLEAPGPRAGAEGVDRLDPEGGGGALRGEAVGAERKEQYAEDRVSAAGGDVPGEGVDGRV